ncbi:hypothetical protein [Marinobacter xestospongiae]|uniref:Ankyrin repeat domain-containing protein n=1 Tax=Marinobacter xestospongiae TaxID=994319 RepID=A0ABU3VXA3_9GAMM|nr:hypothetical protein [Marinobacter xestospongiae]MDV2078910.1 hypothetical protein [Marinobacter xestospongiae]
MSGDKEFFADRLPKAVLEWFGRDVANDERYIFPIGETSPIGWGVVEDLFSYSDDVSSLFDDRGFFHIGSNIYGSSVCISLRKIDFGKVYYFDNEHRSSWEDSVFESFDSLDSDVAEYLEKRKAGKLGSGISGEDDYYFVAASLGEFFECCVVDSLEGSFELSSDEDSVYRAIENFDSDFLLRLVKGNPGWRNQFGATASELAAAEGYFNSLKLLVENGAGTDKCLRFARNNDQKDIVEYLLSRGV